MDDWHEVSGILGCAAGSPRTYQNPSSVSAKVKLMFLSVAGSRSPLELSPPPFRTMNNENGTGIAPAI
jgi:hypothetical protein